ncbi:MAG: DNA-binding transcriptional regulator YiaG [Flavobacteriaceae bacterium]|jgi:DNA-binding transcriptional regulator YiaG
MKDIAKNAKAESPPSKPGAKFRNERLFVVFRLGTGLPLKSVSFPADDVMFTASKASDCLSASTRSSLITAHAKKVIASRWGEQAQKVVEMQQMTQGDFLRGAAERLNMSQQEFSERINTPFRTYEKWLFPATSPNAREMPDMAWTFIDEILEKL